MTPELIRSRGGSSLCCRCSVSPGIRWPDDGGSAHWSCSGMGGCTWWPRFKEPWKQDSWVMLSLETWWIPGGVTAKTKESNRWKEHCICSIINTSRNSPGAASMFDAVTELQSPVLYHVVITTRSWHSPSLWTTNWLLDLTGCTGEERGGTDSSLSHHIWPLIGRLNSTVLATAKMDRGRGWGGGGAVTHAGQYSFEVVLEDNLSNLCCVYVLFLLLRVSTVRLIDQLLDRRFNNTSSIPLWLLKLFVKK